MPVADRETLPARLRNARDDIHLTHIRRDAPRLMSEAADEIDRLRSAEAAARDAALAALVPAELRALSERATAGEWYFEHGPDDIVRVFSITGSQVSLIIEGRGEDTEELEFASASANFVRSLLALRSAPGETA